MSSLSFIYIHKQRKLSSYTFKLYSSSIYLKMPKPHSSLPNLRPDNRSANPRESQHIPFILKIKPQPVTQIKQSNEGQDSRPETFDSLLKEEACLILKQARVIHKQTAKLHHQTETLHHQTETLHHQTKTLLQAGNHQMREEFYQLHAEIDSKQVLYYTISHLLSIPHTYPEHAWAI